MPLLGLQLTEISRLTEIKDLGLVFDQRFSFIPHITQLTLSACRIYGFIVRNARLFENSSTIIHLFNALVRSKLEYGCLIWRPIYNCHAHHLETVQRRFLKWLSYREDGLYPPRGYDHSILLSRFNSKSLECRRGLHAIKFLHGLLGGRIDCVELLSKLDFFVPRPNARTRYFFYISTPRTNLLLQSPLRFACSVVNSLADRCDLHSQSLVHICDLYLNGNI